MTDFSFWMMPSTPALVASTWFPLVALKKLLQPAFRIVAVAAAENQPDMTLSPLSSDAKPACLLVASESAWPRSSKYLLRFLMRVESGATSPSTVTARFWAMATIRSWKSTCWPPTL